MFVQLIKYGTAGAVGTAVQFAILVGLVEFFRSNAVLASTLGAVAGGVVNYVLNYEFTFQSRRPHADSLLKYLMVSVAGLALNALVLTAGISVLGLHYFGAQLFATAVVFCAAFAVNRAWTF
jgi:putative flippase GtrA